MLHIYATAYIYYFIIFFHMNRSVFYWHIISLLSLLGLQCLMIIRPLKALRAEWFCTFWKLTWFTLFRFYFLFETFVIVSQHVVHEHVKKLMDKLKGNFSWCCIENWRFSLFSIFFHFFCSGACKFFSLRDAKLILPLQTPMVIPCV